MELQKLQKEKERLHQEQEAIACREMMLNELVRQSTTSPPLKDMKCMPATCAMNPLGQAMQSSCSATGAGVDPFLGQGNSNTTLESHVRQNSADSGLGGMGTTYSLPRSPEDYLSNVDEMELQEGNNMAPMQPGSCYMNVIGMPDMADAGLLDSDHLMSSLSDDIANDLLNEMDVKKMDSLLYI
jgi:protein yorkie